jgi:hypothetical protein
MNPIQVAVVEDDDEIRDRCKVRQAQMTQSGRAVTELREAFAVRGACSRFQTAPSFTTAPATWTHSKRFACQFIHENPRSLRRISTAAIKASPRAASGFGLWFFVALLVGLSAASLSPAAALSDPAVDSYNMRVGTQTFSGLYKFTTNTLLVETAEAITNLGSDTIKFYMGHNTSGQSGVTLSSNITNLLTLARDEPSYRRVLDMPFRHLIIWEYPFSNPDAPFQDGNYTSTEQANDYREMYDLTRYFLTNYNGSGKTFFLGHWEGDGYLSVNNWTTNPSAAVVSGMILWENTRQKAVDDA